MSSENKEDLGQMCQKQAKGGTNENGQVLAVRISVLDDKVTRKLNKHESHDKDLLPDIYDDKKPSAEGFTPLTKEV